MEHAYGPVFSSLAKACEKQFRLNEAESLWKISNYLDGIMATANPQNETPPDVQNSVFFGELVSDFTADGAYFEALKTEALTEKDRGALRMGVWGSKVNAIQKSTVVRYMKQGSSLLEGKSIFVCEACGFIFIGEEAPEICPVCKAPQSRFSKIS